MKIYRVEHKETGLGPYTSDWEGRHEMDDAHSELENMKDHPTPEWDVDMMYGCNGCEFTDRSICVHDDLQGNEMICGFNSIEQLRNWFDGWLDRLAASDFIIQEYDAALHLDILSKQVIFDPTMAEKGKQLPLVEAKTLADTIH